MRATVTRNTGTGTNDWNRPDPALLTEVGVIACRAWSKEKKDVDDSNKTGVIEGVAVLIPVAADVKERDRLEVRDRLGFLQFGGPIYVETLRPMGGSGSRANHRQLFCKRHL
ncbi:MAG: hypothetical protein GY898_23235 [Proteobacteria bacterium]|nr:hypothetical protein [Pseudomonadota bacterium]